MTDTIAQSTEATPLPWGRHYLMVEPRDFRVAYAINPFMHLDDQPDAARAHAQWTALVGAVEAAGGTVEVLASLAETPDMVFAMNLGLALSDRAVLSHMRYAERRPETPAAQAWFADHGLAPATLGAPGLGPHFEAGDAFAWRGDLVVGFGPRTEELALKHLATDLGVTVHGLRTTHPGMYHLDLAFCPLDDTHAMVCPAALDGPSGQALLDLVPEPLVLTEEEALTFCANSIVVGRTVLMPACPDRVRAQLEEWGFEVVLVEVGEFLKGGGAIRCMTNPLDLRLGRDLTPVAGGRVVVPPLP